MRQAIANTLIRLAERLVGGSVSKASRISLADASVGDGSGGFLDAYRRHRLPTNADLLAELKNTAWTCASINAALCAAHPPRLYVRTGPEDAPPRCRTKALAADHPLALTHKHRARVEEVIDHPLLTLLRNVNPVHNAFDLWELTELYLEVFGSAYWLLEEDVLEVPRQIWILPTPSVRPERHADSPNIVDAYEVRTGAGTRSYPANQVIHFRFPDPRDPYHSGLSPLKACFEQVALTSQYTAMKRAIYDNTGIPSVFLSPGEVVGEEERQRIETEWNQKFRKGGQGRALVAESSMQMQVLSHSMGDLAALAEARATKEDIANAFHVPIPYLSSETNLANMEAAEVLHLRLAINPRLRRRDEKLNEQLIPHFDPSGRLFLATEDPTPANRQYLLEQQEQDLRLGVRTINEVRIERGLPVVPWGDRPVFLAHESTEYPDRANPAEPG